MRVKCDADLITVLKAYIIKAYIFLDCEVSFSQTPAFKGDDGSCYEG